MMNKLYPKLALEGMTSNRRIYIPYLLASIGMVMMTYIVQYLRHDPSLDGLRGIDTVRAVLVLGTIVITVFSMIFMFYTDSFLIRRRKKEFGLYNILGMDKGNLSKILFWEILMIFVIVIVLGLIMGVLFSKLAELRMVRIMGGETGFDLSVSLPSAAITIPLFAAIFLVLLVSRLIQVRRASAISLIKSENFGEKPPKGNWFLGIIGVALIIGAYAIAVSIRNPLTAFLLFFVAVLMVIAGTYLVMIAASVVVLRLLQKNKGFYYKPNHFISISSMVYRMKRNGAGLASICILATMVLVMLSSTTCLYFGTEDVINSRYPGEFKITATFDSLDENAMEGVETERRDIEAFISKEGYDVNTVSDYVEAYIDGRIDGDHVTLDSEATDFRATTYHNVASFCLMSIDHYNKLTGENVKLEDGTAIALVLNYTLGSDSLEFQEGQKIQLVKILGEKDMSAPEVNPEIIPQVFLFVPDIQEAVKGMEKFKDFSGNRLLQYRWTFNFDTGIEQEKLYDIRDRLIEYVSMTDRYSKFGGSSVTVETKAWNEAEMYSLTGGFFYLGIVLSILFIAATVLIIYYKQVSEGYEDRGRFEIMQKVGMTKEGIRKSINSQLLMVFFLPLILAGLHLAFAFPLVSKLLTLFSLNNLTLFVKTTVLSFLAFGVLYTIIYKITSNVYYRIVSDTKGE